MNTKLLSILLVAVVVLAGCGKKASEKLSELVAEKILAEGMEKDGNVADVKIKDGAVSYTVTDDDGKKVDVKASGDDVTITSVDGVSSIVSGDKAKVPENFPKDVHVFASTKLTSIITAPESTVLVMTSSAPMDEIAVKYQQEMKAKDWKEESFFKAENQIMMAYKKDNRTTSVTLNAEGKVTTISLIVVSEKE